MSVESEGSKGIPEVLRGVAAAVGGWAQEKVQAIKSGEQPVTRIDDAEPNMEEIDRDPGNRSGVHDTAGDSTDHG